MFIGEGNGKENVKRKVIEYGLDAKVLFLGNRDDIPELFMAMDVFVMPSLYEGLPIVAIEAQATGVKTFLSNTISRETEISNIVTWFSNAEGSAKVAELICNVRLLGR